MNSGEVIQVLPDSIQPTGFCEIVAEHDKLQEIH